MQEQTHYQEEVHHDDKGVEVLVVYHYSHQQDWDVDDAEIGEIPDAVNNGREVQWVLQLEVAIGEIKFVEEEEEDAVGEHSGLIVFWGEYWAEEVEVVGEESPLEDEHLIDVVGAEWWFVGFDGDEGSWR